MKIIGLLGGMSWESTALYYRIINETVRDRLGSLHSARLILASVDFHEIERLQHAGDWTRAGEVLAENAQRVEAAGAGNLVLCTNTMHKVASVIERAVSIPLLHIADPTGQAIANAGCRRVGLLGTRFTMEQEFYRERLASRFGLDVLTPSSGERDIVHRVIYDELCLGRVNADSRAAFRNIIANLVDRGAEAIILGCTEITMLVMAEDSPVPVFDTTLLHAVAAAEWAITAQPMHDHPIPESGHRRDRAVGPAPTS